jgi:L-ascorbate metabolism protein UlaG (beta-lactamase superfamily)
VREVLAMVDWLNGITWLGHDSFRVAAPGAVVYIDPWKLDKAEKADLILVTHEHHDHFSPADVEMLRRPETVIVTIQQVATQLKGDVRVVKPGDQVEVKGIAIAAVPAYNPAKQFHPRSAGHVGFVVTIAGTRIYHAGDTDVVPEMASLQVDVALLPVGGKYTMTAAEAAEAADRIKPKVAVPMHWGDIIGSRADAEAFKKLCHVPVVILDPQRH